MFPLIGVLVLGFLVLAYPRLVGLLFLSVGISVFVALLLTAMINSHHLH